MNPNRYEKEIEEILKKAGERPPEKPGEEPDEQPRRKRQPSPRRGYALRGTGLTFKAALLAGIALLIGAVVFETVELYLFLAGAALLVAGYVMYYLAPRRSGGGSVDESEGAAPKMWRGRPIDADNDPHFTNDLWGRK